MRKQNLLKIAASALAAATCLHAAADADPSSALAPGTGSHSKSLKRTAAKSLRQTPAGYLPPNRVPCDPARIDLDAGGSDFSLSNLGTFNVTGQLRDDAVMPPFVEILKNPGKVTDQLQRLYDSGQRKISTVLWHAPLGGTNAAASRSGYLVNSSGGLKADIRAGLEAYYLAVKNIGFTDVVFRAGLQGCARPSNWIADNTSGCPTGYSQEIETDNFAVIAAAHDILDRVFAETKVRRWYDLAVEASGWPKPHPQYNALLWKRYVQRYGSEDSYGFSIAFQPGRLTESYKAYDAAGVRPKMIAVDMYDRIEGGPSMEIMFAKLAKEMRVLGLAETPIVVQETYYNHKPSYHAIVAASEQHGLDIYAIYQWTMDTANLWHDTPARFEAYCPALIEKVATAEQTASAK